MKRWKPYEFHPNHHQEDYRYHTVLDAMLGDIDHHNLQEISRKVVQAAEST